MAVVRVFVVLLFAASLLFGATFKLYLKDGDFHVVREYKVDGDRVRYYSTERSQWEEIPSSLCDLIKTERERQRVATDQAKEAKLIDEEEQYERKQRQDVERIPMNAGAYFVEGDQVKSLEYAESTIVTNKRRQVLKVITPIPLVAGKATVQIKGEHAKFVVNADEPEFYIRLEKEERFGMIQLTPTKGVRIVESIDIMPVTNENFENPKQVPVFQREITSGLFKVWPEKPLAPGEYAVVEFTEGEVNLRIWDFAYRPSTGSEHVKR
jgi:hypothetical protein